MIFELTWRFTGKHMIRSSIRIVAKRNKEVRLII